MVAAPVISFQTAAVGHHLSVVGRRQQVPTLRKCGEMPLNADRNRCACRIDFSVSSPARDAGSAGESSRRGCSGTSTGDAAPRALLAVRHL